MESVCQPASSHDRPQRDVDSAEQVGGGTHDHVRLSFTILSFHRFHIYFIGTEECERSIMRSAINPSKKTWEAYLIDAIGPNYLPLRSHTLQVH